VIDPVALQMVLGVLTGWLERREREAIRFASRVLRVDPSRLRRLGVLHRGIERATVVKVNGAVV